MLGLGLLYCWGLACSSDETTDTGASSTGTSSAASSGHAGSGNQGAGGNPTSSSSSSATGTGGSVGGGGTGGTGGGPPECEASTHTCVPETPVDWTGPLALYTGDGAVAPPACVGTYPTAAGAYNSELDPGVASCNCSCDPAQGIMCTASVNLCYTSSSCFLICNGTNATVPPTACTDISSLAATNVHVSNPAPTSMGSCAPQPNNTLPTPTWGTAAKACGGATTSPTGCMAGELCAPLALAPFDKMCVVHTGDVACPNAFYAEKHVFFENFDDTRACSACSCGAASSTCGGHVDFTQQNCTILVSQVNAGTCATKDLNGFVPTNAIYAPDPSGSCPPSGGVLSGTVTEAAPVTFCCQP